LRHRLLHVGLAASRDVVRNSIILALVEASPWLIGSIAAAIRTVENAFGCYLEGLFVFLAIVFISLVFLSSHVRKTVRMFIERILSQRTASGMTSNASPSVPPCLLPRLEQND
jgi:hypothetical protein